MLYCVWDMVVKLGYAGIEAVIWLEDRLLNPELSISHEHVSVEVISNSTSILHLADHVLHGFP